MNLARGRELWLQRRADVGALALISGLGALFFAWLWRGAGYVIGGDAFLYSYPLRSVAWDMLRHGQLPLWTPLVLSGYPLLAMSQVAVGYPLTWGYLFLPGHVAEQLYVLAPFLLAPAFTYAFARELGRSRTAALLAGLAFGYGGASINLLGVIGMPTNAQMWLPLLLIAVERARTRPFVSCLLGGACAYTMSVLTGYAQSFVTVGLITTVYALYLGAMATTAVRHEHGEQQEHAGPTVARTRIRAWLTWPRWRPLFVALGAIACGAGLAAFQILETLRAARRSVRNALSYESFGEGSFTFGGAWRSFAAPLYTERFADVTTYVPPLIMLLAGAAVVCALRRNAAAREVRIPFWLGVAVLAWLLMLGTNTPFYRLVYYLPILNQFRVPSRHAFEWTFALSILSAYGWDALMARGQRAAGAPARSRHRAVLLAASLCLLSVIAAACWWRATGPLHVAKALYEPHASWYTGPLSVPAYLAWKLAFTLLTLAALWQCGRLNSSRWRSGLLLALVALSCLVEPQLMIAHWWPQYVKTAARLTQPATVTRLLQQAPPAEQRVYTRVQTAVRFAEEAATAPRIDPPNVTARYGLHNVAGYEPLILARYSRALGNVFLDAVNPRRGFAPDLSLFTPQSHVLDILNTTYVAAYANLSTTPQQPLVKDGIEFAAADMGLEVKPHATVTFACAPVNADTLALVTSLANATAIDDHVPVARINILTADNRNIERELRAGRDTAEWAHERADVQPAIRHALAPVFDSRAGDAANSFAAYRYWTRIPLGAALKVVKVEITNLTSAAPLALWRASLYDTAQRRSQPLGGYDQTRWQPVYNEAGALVLRNTHALPRAWLVAAAEAVDGEEALRRIRGESAPDFDPRRIALLEVRPDELPPLPGGPPPNATAQVAYVPNGIEVDTTADTNALLVVSEMTYPGWLATVDDKAATIYTTDFILQSVAVPAGRHHVRLRYSAPAARTGALVGLSVLLVMCALGVYQWRVGTSK